MGFGDWLHWTSIVRDLYLEINKPNEINKKIEIITDKILKNTNKNYGIRNYILRNKNINFKIYFIKFTKNKQFEEIFKNNPYITSNKNYPNLVFFNIISQYYFINNTFLDYQHIIKTYANNIYLKTYKLEPELHFSLNEIKKVDNFIKSLPKQEFVFVEPTNYKIGRSYPFDKFQNIVNHFSNNILFIQISPKIFGIKESKKLDNVLYYEDIFTFRETILFIKYCKFIIVNHGGLSIGSKAVNTKTFTIYPAMFSPKMTKFDNEEDIYIANQNHNSCYMYNPDPKHDFYIKNPLRCIECNNLYNNHDENLIIEKIKNYLNK